MGGQLEADERAVVRLLAEGRLAQVAALLSKRGHRDLVAQVAVTDARARGLAADVPEVEAVLERVEREEPEDSRLRYWGHAMLAERLLLELDGSAFAVARAALDDLAGRRLPPRLPLALRYARARLTRVASLAGLFAPIPDAAATQRALRDEAVAELLACNLVDEVHVSRGLAAGLTVVVAEEDVLENYARLLDARAALPDEPGSMWPPLLDVFVAIVAFDTGDLKAALEAFDRLDALPHLHTRVRGLTAYGRAFFRILTSGPSPHSIAGVERALADVRRHDPRIAQAWHGQLAHLFADLGHPAVEHFARLEAELPPVGPVHALGRDLLRMRVATLAGTPPAADEMFAALERLDGAGFRRRSGRQGLRLGHDLSRAGRPESAARLYAWGRDHMVRGRRQTSWERWWSRPLDRSDAWEQVTFAPVTAPAPSSPASGPAAAGGSGRTVGSGGLEVRVMAPTLTVTIDGEVVALSDVQAKLVLALVVAHPVPLNVEQAGDLLWPDGPGAGDPGEPLSAVRYRLNSLVYRLRRALGTQRSAILRTGDLLQLDADRCEADLWRLRRALVKGTPERVAALQSVTGNLCEAQFPYDEPLVDERRRLCGELVRHARAALRAGEADPASLGPVMLALDLSPDDL